MIIKNLRHLLIHNFCWKNFSIEIIHGEIGEDKKGWPIRSENDERTKK